MFTTLVLVLALTGCRKDDPATEGPSVIFDVSQTATTALPGLADEVEVLVNAYGVPTVFGRNDADVARVHGYLIARDRLFFLDLTRRLGLGTVAALVGQDGLDSDIESRQRGITHVAENILAELDIAPEQAAYADAYAAGINAYIDQVKAGTLPPPAEVELLAPFLGVDPLEALEPFARRDIAGCLAMAVYELAWEPDDLRRANDELRLDGLFDGAPLEELRKAGLRPDVFDRVIPAVDAHSAPDWEPEAPLPFRRGGAGAPAPRANPAMLEGLIDRLERATRKMGKDRAKGFGSNTWAVSGAHTASGHALLASDPHLELSVPSIMWLVGLDTRELGGGDLHVVGHQATPLHYMGTGTNGDLAWGQTNAGGMDITDWYVEQVVLDASGAPVATVFQGADKPLVAVEDQFEIATVPALGSAGGTETITRYTTFDGRWLNSIEGREVGGPDEVGPGETAVNMVGQWIIPEDVDGVDGITAVSFDYTGFDAHALVRAMDGLVRADGIEDFVELSEDFVAYGLQLIVADATGSILYTPYMPMPCRTHLPRGADGAFAEGADPRNLIDGTRYGGFELPADAEGHVDRSFTDDPTRCVLPWTAHPWSLDPEQGFLAAANADPGGLTLDDDLTNDGAYIGGPWSEGLRLGTLEAELSALVARGEVTAEDMQVLQSNHASPLGKWLAPVLVDALDEAEGSVDGPLAEAWAEHGARFAEVRSRLVGWGEGGYQAESGVETFYDGAPTANQRDDAVATMIFNAWMGRFVRMAMDDEGFPKGRIGTYGVLRMMLESRGDSAFASFNAQTGESAYWDILDTEPIETSEEIAVLALLDALAFLEGPPVGDGEGGFGTADMDEWIWGLRHWVHMEPLLLDLLGDDFAFLLADFAVDTSTFPMAEGIPAGDPRASIPGFPRHSDDKCVDAANSGTNGERFSNAYGAVARMVVELGPDGARGVNVLPAGQSADPASPHFADQTPLWLANQSMPISTIPAEIAANAVGRETFTP